MLLAAVLVACVCVATGQATARYGARCGDGAGDGAGVSVRPAPGLAAARYEVEYCAPASPPPTSWRLDLRFLEAPLARCRASARDLRVGPLHSISIEDLEPTNLTCSQICYSKTLDLMFRRCYKLTNQLQRGQFLSQPFHSYYYADNDIPGPEYYYNTSHLVKDFSQDTMVSFYWYPGHIPVTDYEMQVCRANVTEDDCEDVKGNCSRPAPNVHCALALAHGCYYMLLRHTAPWTASGHFEDLRFVTGHFCHRPEAGGAPELPLPAGVYWAGGGCALLALAALAALLAWHSRLLRKLPRLQQRVLDYWLSRRPAGTELKVPVVGGEEVRVLLLYARDCAPAQRAVAALRDLLQAAAPGQVYDIFSEEVTAMAGAAPHAWVRAALSAQDVRVLLLQTPALRALHAPRAQPPARAGDMPLCEPLLPRCVLYRSPHFGDTLLQYALRLMSETAHAAPAAPQTHPQPYHKYYIASLSELPAETFPSVVPFRRYELPGAAGALLRDLSFPGPPPEPPPAAMEALALAAQDLAAFVRDNADYLADELLFL